MAIVKGTFSGAGADVALAGILAQPFGTITALAGGQAGAAALVAPCTIITGGTGGTGVRLPNGRPAGEVWLVKNQQLGSASTGGVYANVWAPTGGSFSGGNGSGFDSVPVLCCGLYFSQGGDVWTTALLLGTTDGFGKVLAATVLTLHSGLLLDGGELNSRNVPGVFGPVNWKRKVVAKPTGPYAYDALSDNNTLFTNEGATGEVVFNLPSAAANLSFAHYVQVAQNLKIQANTGDTIRISGSVGTAAGFTQSSTIGSVIVLTAINATEWIAEFITGTWSSPT